MVGMTQNHIKQIGANIPTRTQQLTINQTSESFMEGQRSIVFITSPSFFDKIKYTWLRESKEHQE